MTSFLRDHAADFRPHPGPGTLPRPGEVEEVLSHATENISPRFFYTAAQLHQYLQVNPEALRCVRTSLAHPGQLTGYFILISLTDRAERLIRDGSIDAGVALPASLTAADPATAHCHYLGMIQGLTAAARHEIICALHQRLSALTSPVREPVRLYARNGHPSSRPVMDKLGFTPLTMHGHPSQIEFTELNHLGLGRLVSANRVRQRRLAERAERVRAAGQPVEVRS